MRHPLDDKTGFLWDDGASEKRRGSRTAKDPAQLMAALPWNTQGYVQPPLVNPPPGLISLDFETDDETLLERGSAWAFSGIGGIIGVAVAWEGFEAYYPIRHREGNVDETNVLSWLRDQLARTDLKFICANAAYDIGWARRETGIYPAGGVEDVQFMAALLDEYMMSYSLDAIAKKYLSVGKNAGVIKDVSDKLSLKYNQVMANLKQLPGAVVAPYAATDARVTYDLYKVLLPMIDAEELRVVHDLESSLIPMSVEMRRRGIRVNVSEAERLAADIRDRRVPETKAEIKRLTGVDVEPWESETLARAMASCGIICDKTRTGQDRIDQDALKEWSKTVPAAAHILSLRKMSKIQTTFLEGHILGHQHLGRVHAEFNQLKSEREDGNSFGTVSGRYSCTAPGMQQIPTRDKEWGPIMRSLFLAEDGQQIASLDYSSQEPRLTVHFAAMARLPGAAEAVAQFQKDPRTDYHGMVAEIAKIPRKDAKTLNLGLAYGMSSASLARALGLPTEWMSVKKVGGRAEWKKIEDKDIDELRSHGVDCIEVAGTEAKAVLKKWEDGAPFIRTLYKLASEVASSRGYIKTILGRRCRFQIGKDGKYDYTHKALNRLAQGSAADQTKRGMLDLWNMGHVPLLTVHDELVFSVDDEQEARRYSSVMENAVPLLVPSIVDVNLGKTWGDISK